MAKAKQRDFIHVAGVSSSPVTLRQMCLLWGITPLADAPVHDFESLAAFVHEWGKAEGLLKRGDRVVYIGGTGTLEVHHNQVIVHVVN